MTQDHSSKLSFSIEESVWLNRGQEVDEVISLSLDPEITVQEQGEYVLIRGGLKLTGEYRSNSNSTPTNETESLASQVAFRSIEEVTLNEDGTGEIRHRFPIDVTIPQERIRSLDDIFVIVDSFDYDLPERGCIQLTADISITGMSSGSTTRPAVADSEEYEEERTFHFESYNEEAQQEEEVSVVSFPTSSPVAEVEREDEEIVILAQTEELEEVEEILEEVRSSEQGIEVEAQQEEEVVLETVEEERDEEVVLETERAEETEIVTAEVSEELEEVAEVVEETAPLASVEVKEIKAPAIAFGVIKDRPKQTTEGATDTPKANSFSLSKSFSAARKEKGEQKQPVARKEADAKDQSENSGAETKAAREEYALYLTKMLTKGDGEQFKKLKICIIRENETLDTIAARYEISQSTLIRVNRLNDSNVKEGQILYIPVTQ